MEDQHDQKSEQGRGSFQGSDSLIEKIEKARHELLDLTTRNRLLHTPRGGRARIIEVVNESGRAMYQTLVADKKRFTFQAGRVDPTAMELPSEADGGLVVDDDLQPATDPELIELIEQPDLELDEEGRVVRHWDNHLSTRLTSSGLQKRLLDLYTDARTLQEEQGVNVLYLAIGYLRWRAVQGQQTDRYAPLVLIPVVLERSNAGEKFHLKWSGDDIQANLSLQLMLRREFQLKLPDIEDFENLDIDAYFREIGTMIEGRTNWAVVADDAVLGLFSFAKFMMYHDLDPVQWTRFGGLAAIDTLRGVVTEGFPGATLTDENVPIDALISPGQTMHIVDSDSSQSLVVHDVRQGRNILVQGPPGTGKSQTIANIIAAAVADNKKVLFVAEKMAALEVVKRRLDNAQIGVACLELHSNKANKRSLLQELSQTWQLAAPQPSDPQSVVRQIKQRREALSAHVARLHCALAPSNLTPYEVLGHLVRLRRLGHVTRRLALADPLTWDADDKKGRIATLQDLIERIDRMGLPKDHAWVGVGNDALLPNDRDRLIGGMAGLLEQLKTWIDSAERLHADLDLPAPVRFADAGGAVARASALVAAPQIGPAAFLSNAWYQPEAIQALIAGLARAQQAKVGVEQVAEVSTLGADWINTQTAIGGLLPTFEVGTELKQLADTHDELTRLQADLVRLTQLLSETAPLTFESAMHLVALGERATSVPEIDRDALVARIWERGVDSIEELVGAVEQVQTARQTLRGIFRDNAWTQQDLEGARTALASRGGSWLKIFSGEWRQANRLVRSYLVNPKLPNDEALFALDTLLDAQTAQRTLVQRDREGQEAFGASWTRERSSVGFLRGVVSWMRTLRPLGADARERLANISDPEQAALVAKRLRPALESLQRALSPVHDALVAHECSPWGGEVVLKRVPLSAIRTHTEPLKAAFEQIKTLRNGCALSLEDVGRAINAIREAQVALAALEDAEPAGQAAFGALWRGIDSAPAMLQIAVQWQDQNPELRALAARIADARTVLAAAEHSVGAASDLEHALQNVFVTLQLADPVGVPRIAGAMPLTDLVELLQRWAADPEGLPQWVAYMAQANKAQHWGLGAIVDVMGTGSLATDQAIGAFELAYFEAVLAKLIERDPSLASFDGQKQSQLVAEFGQLDLERMDIAKRQILAVHHAGIPQTGGIAGPTKILRGEMAKKKGHLPIRRLMEHCGAAVQALKPVFMMSPLSVAQFLPPGALSFDMLIIDEASQVQPVDAFGAIARAKQLVIVGDERQLPPTQFFAKTLAGDDGANDEDGAQAADVESILGLCRAQGLPERMLEWHYHSRHQSLIAVSNRQFYGNKLKIVPSPFTDEAGVGLRFHHLPEAVYDRGGKRTNAAEAKAVAEAVIAHALDHPNLSLGVVAFSTQQRRAILDEVELLRRQHPETEGYFAGRPDEPFFIKNLENVQGDERDVIFISIGYGRDATGAVRMEFGPVSREGGERRLNVLISRAKTRCEVFSSITDDDIDTDRGKGKGTLALKLFLHYARTGRMELAGTDPNRHQRIFEEQVAAALRAQGYDLHTDVGIAGFFVDIAVADPAQAGRYILGVEFDGPSYCTANGTRDRDRLRENALAVKGWRLHRVWIYDWFQRPQAELERLVKAIEAAKQEPARFETQAPPRQRAVSIEVKTVDMGDTVQVGLVPSELPVLSSSDRYVEADFRVPSEKYELHEVPPHRMAEIVRQVVIAEGPIHRNEVVIRIRSLWRLQRAGSRIQASVDAGIAAAIAQHAIRLLDEDFLDVSNREPKVRDRSAAASLTLRRPDYLPPSEVGVAILTLVRDNLGATIDEVIHSVARQFGYKSTSVQLRVVIEDRTKYLVEHGHLKSDNGVLTVASALR